MSNASRLKNELNPLTLSYSYHSEFPPFPGSAGDAIVKAFGRIPEKYTKLSIKAKIRIHFAEILDVNTGVFFDEIYDSLNPQNKVLVNGIFFKEFFHNLKTSLNEKKHLKQNVVLNEKELKKLIDAAEQLIPLIYITQPYKSNTTNQTGQTPEKATEPAYVPNSLRARFVSDDQVNTVKKLHEIFTQIVNITAPENSKQK